MRPATITAATAATALIALAGVAAAAPMPAQAKPGDIVSFDGRCDVYGAVTFQRDVTTAVETHTYEFRTADELTTCAGSLKSGTTDLGNRTWKTRFVVGGTGPASCQQSTITGGRGQITFLDAPTDGVPVTLDTAVDIFHVLNSVVVGVTGGEGTRALARATFLPTPEAIMDCGQKGIRSLPFNGTVLTSGALRSSRPLAASPTAAPAPAPPPPATRPAAHSMTSAKPKAKKPSRRKRHRHRPKPSRHRKST